MATSQLTLYNGALRLLGQPKLSALTDAVESRRLLDDAWDENARDYCLEEGLWNFAMRTVEAEYDSSVDPDFGFLRAFTKPTDWIRTAAVASDEYFINTLTDQQFNDEQGYLFADLDTLFWKYVSSDTSYGYDLSLWPQTFVRYVESYLAFQIAPRLSVSDSKIETIGKIMDRARLDAKAKDATNEGAKFPPEGSWNRSRRGWRVRDRVGRRLIG